MRFKRAKVLDSLALRIVLAYVAGALLSVALLVFLMGAIAQEFVSGKSMHDRTLALEQQLTFDASGRPSGFSSSRQEPLWLYDSLWQETAYRVLDQNGQVILLSAGAKNWPEHGDVAKMQRGLFTIENNGVLLEGATHPIVHGGKTWYLQLTASSRGIDFLRQEFAIPFIRFGGVSLGMILLFVFVPCAYLSLRFSLRPLRRVSLAATEISLKSLNERLQTDRVPIEISPLIENFNVALDRIERGFRIQQDFLAKAAHELKTPLALIRAEVDLMEISDDARKSLLAPIEHLSRHVQQLLLLAEASEPLSYQFADVDVHEVVADAHAFLQKIADEAGVHLTRAAGAHKVIWRADHGSLFTLLKNLIENAIQHAPPGTEIRTTISQGCIQIRDWGPGLAPEQLQLMFTRFWRGKHRRDEGAGLGLAICKEISVAHGWSLSAHNRQPGLELMLAQTKVP